MNMNIKDVCLPAGAPPIVGAGWYLGENGGGEHEHKGCLLACRSTAHSGGRLVSGGERGEGPRTARCCRLIRRPLSLTRNAETVASRGGWSAWWCRTSRRPCLRVSLVCTPCFKRAYIKMWPCGHPRVAWGRARTYSYIVYGVRYSVALETRSREFFRRVLRAEIRLQYAVGSRWRSLL